MTGWGLRTAGGCAEKLSVGVLTHRVQIRDVEDADGFVTAALDRLGLDLSYDDRQELECEGLAILCELSATYRSGAASFSTYAGGKLGGRLIDAWHRLHRGEHIRRPSRDGHRVWDYQTIASLDQLRDQPAFREHAITPVAKFARITD